jgi:hypothetical protein
VGVWKLLGTIGVAADLGKEVLQIKYVRSAVLVRAIEGRAELFP